MNKNTLPSIFLLFILFKFIGGFQIQSESKKFRIKIEIETNEAKKQIDLNEAETIDFMENMKKILNVLPDTKITTEDFQKLGNEDIIAKSDEIKQMDKFLQEKIIPKNYKKETKEYKSVSELILFYQMAKITLEIVNDFKFNGYIAWLNGNIFCLHFENHSCRMAGEQFPKKLENFINVIQKFFKNPPKGFSKEVLNVINSWKMLGNLYLKEFSGILKNIDDLKFNIKIERKYRQISILKISHEKKMEVDSHSSEELHSSAEEEEIVPISVENIEEKDGKIVEKKELKLYEIHMAAYKARELIVDMDELIKNLMENEILPFNKDKKPIPSKICKILATSTYFDGMINKRMEYSKIIADYREEAARYVLRSEKEYEYNEERNEINIGIPKSEVKKLMTNIKTIRKEAKDIKNVDVLCPGLNETFRGLKMVNSYEKWDNEIFKDLKRQAKETFKIEEKNNCFDDMLELRTFTAIVKEILDSKEGYHDWNWKNMLAEIAEMIGEWMMKKDVQKNSLERWEEFEEKWILKKFSVSMLEDDSEVTFKSKDEHYINCFHNLMTLRLLDGMAIGLLKRAMSYLEKDQKQIEEVVFQNYYTKDWKFHENLTQELPKMITSTIGGISNQNGKWDVDLWVDMEKNKIANYNFNMILNFDKSLDPREIKKKMALKRLEEEMRREAERLEAERRKKEAERLEAERKKKEAERLEAERKKKEAAEKALREREEAERKRKETEKETTFNITLKWYKEELKEFMQIIQGMIQKFKNLDRRNFNLCEMLWETAQDEFWGLITFNVPFSRILNRIREELAKKMNLNSKGKVVMKYKEIYGKSKLNMPKNCIYDAAMTYTAAEIASRLLGDKFFRDLVFRKVSKNSLKRMEDDLDFIREKALSKILGSEQITEKNWNLFHDKWFKKAIKIKLIDNDYSDEEGEYHLLYEVTHHEIHYESVATGAPCTNGNWSAHCDEFKHHQIHFDFAATGDPCSNGNWSVHCEYSLNHAIPHSFKPNQKKSTKEPKGIYKNAEPPKKKGMHTPISKSNGRSILTNDYEPKNSKSSGRSILTNDYEPKNSKSSGRSILKPKKSENGRSILKPKKSDDHNKKEEIPLKSFLRTHSIPKNFAPKSSKIDDAFKSIAVQKFIYDDIPGDGDCLFSSIVHALNAGNGMNETKILEKQIAILRKLVSRKLVTESIKMTKEQKMQLFTHIMSEDTWKSKDVPDSWNERVIPHGWKKKDWVIQNYAAFMAKSSKGDSRKWGGQIEITYAQKLLNRQIVVIQMPAGESPEKLEQLEKSIAKHKNDYTAIWADSVPGKNMKDLGLINIQSLNDFFNKLKAEGLETTIVLTHSTNHYRPIYKIPPSQTVKDKNTENLKLFRG